MNRNIFYFSKDGKTQYGSKYKDLSDVRIELDDPENKKGYTVQPVYDPVLGKGYWEYIKNPMSDDGIEGEIEELKHENQLLKAQNNALSERADFIEDVVAEMATQVYQ